LPKVIHYYRPEVSSFSTALSKITTWLRDFAGKVKSYTQGLCSSVKVWTKYEYSWITPALLWFHPVECVQNHCMYYTYVLRSKYEINSRQQSLAAANKVSLKSRSSETVGRGLLLGGA